MDIGNLSLQEGVLLSFLDRQLKLSEAADAEEVARAIEQARTISALELRGNTVGIGGGERIAQALRRHPELKRCLWSDMFTGRLKNEIPPILLSMTAAMMQAGCQITELDLSDNAFGPIGAEGIQDFLVSPSAYSLEVLKLNNNGLGAGGQIIAKCLVQCHSNAQRDGREFRLKTFVAGRNRLENPGAKELAKAFRIIKTLEHISIPQNGIRKEGIIELADSLKFNRNLKTIVFNDNTCDTDGAHHIAKALPELKQLQVLDLGDCLCRSSGCSAIIAQICDGEHKDIQIVDLCGSELPGEHAVRIIKTWGDRFGQKAQLKLSHNMFGSMFEDLEEEIERRKLNVDMGSVSDDEGSASEKYSDSEEDESSSEDETRIVREVQTSAHHKAPVPDMVDELLTSGVGCLRVSTEEESILSFLDRQLKLSEAADAEEVARAIEQTRTISALELRGNTVGIGGGERIAQALRRHPELKRCLWSDMFTGRLKNEIPPILLSMTAAMMQAGCQITELDLSDNAFGPIGAEGIQDFLVSPSAYSLEVLKLNNNGLGAGGQIIAKCLVQCHSNAQRDGREFRLKTFVAGRNRLENPGAKELAKAFRIIKTLEHISIPQNGIRKEGIIELADSLEYNKNLKTIVFNDNTCDTVGAYHIAKALTELKQLQVLDLGDCLCRSSGCASIIAQICDGEHHEIRMVDLSGSELPGERARQILTSWKQSYGRTDAELKLSHNMFGSLFDVLEAKIRDEHLKVDIGSFSDDEGSESEKYSGDENDDESDTTEDEIIVVSECVQSRNTPAAPKQDGEDAAVQERAARYLLELALYVQANGGGCEVLEEAVQDATKMVQQVASVLRRPIPTTTQMLNNVIAQIGLGVKPEQKWNINPEPRIVGNILQRLLAAGQLQEDRQLINFYFPM